MLIGCAAAIICGILLGNGAVWIFNRIPGKWLCDYGQTPDEELLHPTRQRVCSTPWKYVFSGLFIVIGIKLFLENPAYGVAALAVCWLLLEMAIADIKYRIVPDQFVMLLVITGIGFIPFHRGGPLNGLWGALAGFGVMTVVAVLGGLLYQKNTLGGGDIKLFAALGLVAGVDGILWIFVLTSLLSGAHMAWLLFRRRVKLSEHRAMAPYIGVSAGIYLVLLHEMRYNILISL
jgi:Flp pilus assembly protein protease CpaA